MNRILLVEDDTNISSSIRACLLKEGYTVDVAGTLEEARQKMKSPFSVILLDWMLPDGQGIDFLKRLRAEGSQTPVILVTARTELVDKVIGLETGANDYIVKPFEPRELIARTRVQLRETSRAPRSNVLRVAGIELDREQRMVTYLGKAIEFSKMEFELLALFIENPNRVFSREELLNRIWGYENFPSTRTVDTHILMLRNKLEETFFQTVRGIGYRFVPQDTAFQ